MLELAGVAYSGPDPVSQANLLDRYVLLSLLQDAGINVPRFALANAASATINSLEFPISVKHRHDPDIRSIRVRNHKALEKAAGKVMQASLKPALLEEKTRGRGFRVSLIGNEQLECLPLLELGSATGESKSCPAELDDSTADLIREIAYNAFKASGCRDYARVDVRLSEDGEITVVSIHWDGVLARRGSFIRSAEAAGYSYAQVIHRIIDTASARYGTAPQNNEVTPFEPAEYSKWLPGKRVGAQ